MIRQLIVADLKRYYNVLLRITDMNFNEMNGIANRIMHRLGANIVFIFLRPTKQVIAGATGGRIDNVPLFQNAGKVVAGIIYIDRARLRGFSHEEIEFIFTHECVHIYMNHSITTFFWKWLEKSLKGDNNENYDLIEAAKVVLSLMSPDHLPPNAITLRDQEFEADSIAVRTTGDLRSAVSCLTKLCGGNLNGPSHVWELFDIPMPAMTMQQRTVELQRRVSLLDTF